MNNRRSGIYKSAETEWTLPFQRLVQTPSLRISVNETKCYPIGLLMNRRSASSSHDRSALPFQHPLNVAVLPTQFELLQRLAQTPSLRISVNETKCYPIGLLMNRRSASSSHDRSALPFQHPLNVAVLPTQFELERPVSKRMPSREALDWSPALTANIPARRSPKYHPYAVYRYVSRGNVLRSSPDSRVAMAALMRQQRTAFHWTVKMNTWTFLLTSLERNENVRNSWNI